MKLLRKRERDPDKVIQRQESCPAHKWSEPRPWKAFWLDSYWVSKCSRCGATVGRATEQELRDALPSYPRGRQVGPSG